MDAFRFSRLMKLRWGLLGCALALALAAPSAQATLSWNATSHDFGSVLAGGGKKSALTFTLTATCDGGSVVICTSPGIVQNFGAPVISGDGFTISSIPTNTCAAGLLVTATFPGSNACVTGVTFSPASSGPKTGTLTLPAGPDVSLTGAGVTEGGEVPQPGTTKKKKCGKGKKRSAAAAKKKCRKKKK